MQLPTIYKIFLAGVIFFILGFFEGLIELIFPKSSKVICKIMILIGFLILTLLCLHLLACQDFSSFSQEPKIYKC